jgi:KRAB domain-containing zinc finger protein
MCLQTFGLNSELEEHICEEEPISNSRLKNQATKKRRNKSNTKTTASKSKERKIKNEVDNEIDFSPSSEMYTKLTCSQCLKIVDTKEDLKLHWVLQHGIAIENFDEQDPSSKENDGEVLPAVEMPMREENGRFYCLSGDCAVKKQSSKWLRGFKEHFMEKHAPENLKTFGCKFCNELFASSGIRNKHQKVHFPKDDSDPLESREETDLLTPLVCLKETDIEVKVNTNKSSDLSQSQSNEIPMREENGRFFCLSGDCEQTGGRSFNWLGGLKEHYNKVHDPDYQKTVPCKYCGMLFASVGLRNKHIKSDHVKEKGESNKISKFTCSVCSEVFNLASSLKIHLLKHPELSVKTGNKVKLRPFHCDQCDKSFVKPCHLRDHQIVHSEERYFICDKCGKSYKEKGELTRHKQIHEDVIVDCEFCELKFVGQYLYSRHLRRKHQSTYTCNDCGKTYGYKYTFDMHMRTHSGERPYVCELCGASYPIQGSLTHHLKASHSNWHKERKKEKQCDQCQRFFYTTHSLNLHIKTVHENVKDYHCAECGNSYKGSTQLKRHMETHSGITINCQYCERKFNSTSYYKKHLKRKHKANDST